MKFIIFFIAILSQVCNGQFAGSALLNQHPKAITSSSYTATPASYSDGTQNAYVTIDSSATPVCVISLWINPASTASQIDLAGDDNVSEGFFLRMYSGGALRFVINGGGPDSTTTGTLTANIWNNVLIAYNSGTSKLQIYINNVNAAPSTPSFASMVPVFNCYEPLARSSTAVSVCIAEFYFEYDSFIDFSVSGNRSLFNDGGSPPNPVSLGANGNLPTGTQPEMYFKAGGASWGSNAGSAGNATVSGTFGTSCTIP